MRKLKLLAAVLMGLLPLNFLRVFGYRLLGYKINGAKIGFATVIAVDEAEIRACKIGMGNLFTGPMKMAIGDGAMIGHLNIFSCGYWTTRPEYAEAGYERELLIGRDCLVTSQHYIDLAGRFELGNGSWIAGFSSQFWTHGAGTTDREIRVGERSYLGSAVRFAPGTSVGDDSIVAMGSVVTKKFRDDRVLVGGVPAKMIKENLDRRVNTSP